MKKTIRTMISAAIIIGLMIPVSAGAASKANFYSNDQFSNVTITNSNEEKVVFPTSEDLHNDSVVEGNMAHKIYWSDGGEGTGEYGSMDRLEVDDSDEFVITPTKSEWEDFGHRRDNEGLGIELNSSMHKKAYAYGDFIDSVGFIKNGIWVKSSKYINGKYDIGLYLPSQKDRINILGTFPDSKRKMMIKDDGGNVKLTGVTGRTTFYADNGKGKSRYYLYGGTSVLKKEKDGLVSAKPGVKLNEKVSKTVTNLYIRPTNSGKNLFLTWNKVKGANFYYIYKYDLIKNEYVLAEENLGHAANFYNVPMKEVKNDRGYKFYIKAVKWNWDTGKVDKVIDKRSYAVWAVSAGNAKGNVSEVKTNYKKLTKKMGQKVKLTAIVKTKDGKKPISKTIRWFTSNKKIVKLNKTTGQCVFKKKGKCDIWAKAHNGKNSKKITVVVK